MKKSVLSTEAINVVEKAFKLKGGYTAALAEAKYGRKRGATSGLRYHDRTPKKGAKAEKIHPHELLKMR